MEIRVFDSYEELSKSAAGEVIRQVTANPKSVLGLATGSSPIGLYREVILDHQKNGTSYKDVMTFNLDEYFGIDKSHSQSYYNFMQNHLFKHIDINEEHIHIPSGDTDNVLVECETYNKKLNQQPIDIQVLGIGRNGHIGFNEPGTSFDSETHHVVLDEKTRNDNARFFYSIEEVPTHAVTMGIKNILSSRKILLIATGESKADAIFAMLKGPCDPKCPASALQMHNQVIVFLDKAAAKRIML